MLKKPVLQTWQDPSLRSTNGTMRQGGALQCREQKGNSQSAIDQRVKSRKASILHSQFKHSDLRRVTPCSTNGTRHKGKPSTVTCKGPPCARPTGQDTWANMHGATNGNIKAAVGTGRCIARPCARPTGQDTRTAVRRTKRQINKPTKQRSGQ